MSSRLVLSVCGPGWQRESPPPQRARPAAWGTRLRLAAPRGVGLSGWVSASVKRLPIKTKTMIG